MAQLRLQAHSTACLHASVRFMLTRMMAR